MGIGDGQRILVDALLVAVNTIFVNGEGDFLDFLAVVVVLLHFDSCGPGVAVLIGCGAVRFDCIFGSQLNIIGFPIGAGHGEGHAVGADAVGVAVVVPDLSHRDLRGFGDMGIGDGAAVDRVIPFADIAYFVPFRHGLFFDGVFDFRLLLVFGINLVLGQARPGIGPGVTVLAYRDRGGIGVALLFGFVHRSRCTVCRCGGDLVAVVIPGFAYGFFAIGIERQFKGFRPQAVPVIVVVPNLVDGDINKLIFVGEFDLVQLVGFLDRSAGDNTGLEGGINLFKIEIIIFFVFDLSRVFIRILWNK